MSVKYFGSDALNKLIDLVKTALGLKADDSNVVHKTGDETVAGEKSFSDRASIQKTGSDTPLLLKGSSDTSWIAFATASGGISNPMGYIGVKSDNKPYFYSGGAKRLALLDETMPYYYKYDGQTHNCNDWTSQGIYVDYGVTNAPEAGWVTIVTLLAGYPRQFCYPFVSNTVYSRYKNSSTWSSWSNVSQIKSFRTSNITLSSLTWTQSSSGKYYTNTDSGLSSSDKIIGIFIADWGYMINGIIVQPYVGGTDSNKIRLMSNTNSFGNAFMSFMVLYT